MMLTTKLTHQQLKQVYFVMIVIVLNILTIFIFKTNILICFKVTNSGLLNFLFHKWNRSLPEYLSFCYMASSVQEEHYLSETGHSGGLLMVLAQAPSCSPVSSTLMCLRYILDIILRFWIRDTINIVSSIDLFSSPIWSLSVWLNTSAAMNYLKFNNDLLKNIKPVFRWWLLQQNLNL